MYLYKSMDIMDRFFSIDTFYEALTSTPFLARLKIKLIPSQLDGASTVTLHWIDSPLPSILGQAIEHI